MRIFIPSSNRARKQTTYDNLPDDVKADVSIVVPWEQRKNYDEVGLPILCTPPNVRGIGQTRQWICEEVDDPKVLMLDDDLVFATRREDDPTKFRDSTEEEVRGLLEGVDEILDTYAHGAVAPREGGNRVTESYLYNTRCLRALFYRTDILKEHGIRFTDMEVMEDFHVALSLLRLGYCSISINTMVQNQNGSDLPGGCSVYRTPDVQRKAALELQARHPDFVTVVEKTTKTAWGGGTRTDVRVAWKGAYNSAAPATPGQMWLSSQLGGL